MINKANNNGQLPEFIYWPLIEDSFKTILQRRGIIVHSEIGDQFIGMPGDKIVAYANYKEAKRRLREDEEEFILEMKEDSEIDYEDRMIKFGLSFPENPIYKSYLRRVEEEISLARSLTRDQNIKKGYNLFCFDAKLLGVEHHVIYQPIFYILKLSTPALQIKGNKVIIFSSPVDFAVVKGKGFSLLDVVSDDCRKAIDLEKLLENKKR